LKSKIILCSYKYLEKTCDSTSIIIRLGAALYQKIFKAFRNYAKVIRKLFVEPKVFIELEKEK